MRLPLCAAIIMLAQLASAVAEPYTCQNPLLGKTVEYKNPRLTILLERVINVAGVPRPAIICSIASNAEPIPHVLFFSLLPESKEKGYALLLPPTINILSDEAFEGILAHEMAHVSIFPRKGIPSGNATYDERKAWEVEADALAAKWVGVNKVIAGLEGVIPVTTPYYKRLDDEGKLPTIKLVIALLQAQIDGRVEILKKSQ